MKPPRPYAPVLAPSDARDDDLDFAGLMLRDGVKPVATDVRRDPAARSTATPVDRSTKPAAPRAAAPARPTATTRAAPGVAAPATTADDPAASASHREMVARTRVLMQERDAAILATASLRAELAALTDRYQARTRERDLANSMIAASAPQRSADAATEAALRSELSEVRAAVQAAQRSPESPRTSLAAALRARGLDVPSEQARALALLTDGEAATRLLELLETRDPAALASLLERRLALVCGDPGCAPELGAAALQVPSARCEVCGGSDIRRGAHLFIRTCAVAGVVRVRFVGGSPNYRTKLAALFPAGGPLTVHTTAGDKHVRLSRSRSQQRGDDLVIIWGATELDHATSGAYRAEHGRTEVIAHRGIGRMLELAAGRIAGAPPGRSPGAS